MKLIILLFVSVLVSLDFCAEAFPQQQQSKGPHKLPGSGFPQNVYISTFLDATFVSKNYPSKKIGIDKNGVRGLLTDDNVAYQHFNLDHGICGKPGTVSFESVAKPGSFLRHQDFQIKLHSRENTPLYMNDACFYPRYNKYFPGYTAYESVNYPGYFIRHRGFKLYIDQVQNTDLYRLDVSWKTNDLKTYDDATFVSYDWPTHKIGLAQQSNKGALSDANVAYQHYKVVEGICGIEGAISFESVANPGQFLRHHTGNIYLDKPDGSDLFRKDACFYPRYNKYFHGFTAYESVNYPNNFIRHADFILWLQPDDGSALFKAGASWKTTIPQAQQVSTYDDATFVSYDWPGHKIGLAQQSNHGALSNANVAYQHYKVVEGLCSIAGTISFESVSNPGQFLRHNTGKIYLDISDGSDLFRSDACFFPRYNKYFHGFTAYESVNYPNQFIRHANFILWLQHDDGSALFKAGASWKTTIPQVQQVTTYDDATFQSYDWPTYKIGIQHGYKGYMTNRIVDYQHFKVVQGLCSIDGTISFESVKSPGHFLRHNTGKIYLDKSDGSDLFRSDACFFPRYNKYFHGFTAYESVNYPNQFIRHANFFLWLNHDDGSALFKAGASWKTIASTGQVIHTQKVQQAIP